MKRAKLHRVFDDDTLTHGLNSHITIQHAAPVCIIILTQPIIQVIGLNYVRV